MIIYDFLELWRCICMEMKTRGGNFQNIEALPKKRTDESFFRVVCLEAFAEVEVRFQAGIILYELNIVYGSVIDEVASRNVTKYSNTAQLLPYKSHTCFISTTIAFFKAFRCPFSDQFIKRARHLERHLTSCKERVEHVFTKKVYQLRETLFDELDLFTFTLLRRISYSKQS